MQVKRLAYDLCKMVPLTDEDTYAHLLPGIKVRALVHVGQGCRGWWVTSLCMRARVWLAAACPEGGGVLLHAPVQA